MIVDNVERHKREMVAASLPMDVHRRILARQAGGCFYCEKPLGARYVLDHLIPRHAGGPHFHHNRVAACSYCDGGKGGRMPTREEMDRQVAMVAKGETT